MVLQTSLQCTCTSPMLLLKMAEGASFCVLLVQQFFSIRNLIPRCQTHSTYIVTYFWGLGVLLGCDIVLSFCRFGSTSRPIWLDNVRCSGNESRLASCSRSSYGAHNCDHSKDVAIYCYTSGSNTGSGIPGTISSICFLPTFR